MNVIDVISTLNTINNIANMDYNDIRCTKGYKQRADPFELVDEEFRKIYRFSKPTVKYIINLIKDQIKVDPRGGGTPPDLQVLTSLRCWGRREVQDECGNMHGLSQPTCSRICSKVASAIAQHGNEYIKMPSSIAEENVCMAQFKHIGNFPSVIGVIGCTNIKINKTRGNISRYFINDKAYISLSVQVVCDANLQIRNIIAEWQRSTHDNRIFSESSIRERFEQGQFDGRLLGNSGYPLLPFLFTPILNPTSIKEEHYNAAHNKTRNTVERCFGVWKQRFRCLLDGITISPKTAQTLILALAVLHNIASQFNDRLLEENITVNEKPVTYFYELEGGMQRRQSRLVLNDFIQNNF